MKFWKKLKNFSTAAVVFAIIYLVAKEALSVEKFGKKPTPINELKRVIFSTNGKITSRWAANELAIKRRCDLFALDIFAMKRQLENVSQIKKVFIEKRYPDTLFIKVEERSPILKVAIRANGETKLFLIDGADGQIFNPIGYSRQEIADILPVDMLLQTAGKGTLQFLPLKGAPLIKEFVTTMKNSFPNIFNEVKFINLKNYDSRPKAIWSTIELSMKNGIVVVF
jgi:hypothetical protein